jgi:hypothetical protein
MDGAARRAISDDAGGYSTAAALPDALREAPEAA